MATIPTLESIFLEVHQSLGLPPFTSKKKASFSDLGMSLENHNNLAVEILNGIFDALNMDNQARMALEENIFTELAQFNKAVELHTWTFEADKRQILWHFLGYVFVPWFARKLAFWNLPESFDTGMPTGEFWFIPNFDKSPTELSMPVTKVVDWLLDLLGLPMDEVKENFGGKRAKRANNQDSIERNLYNWKKGNIPKFNKINEYFPDDAKLEFKGVFEIKEDLSQQAQFEEALEFVKRKELNAEKLSHQIPYDSQIIEEILKGNADDKLKQRFISRLSERYAKPDMRSIRQRFLVARMIQDGYRRLVNYLCPNVKETCTDRNQNKVLQLLEIFKGIYNLTVEAYKQNDSEEAENEWFEEQLAFWCKETICLSILPSRFETAHREVSELLTRVFSELSGIEELENLIIINEESGHKHIESKLNRTKKYAEESQRINEIIKKLHSSSSWRTLQKEDSYWVLSQISLDPKISFKARDAAVNRMKELNLTPSQKISTVCIELGYLLNSNKKQRPKDVENIVQQLLEEAKKNEQGYQVWKAPLLQYEAKHLLAQNNFSEATKYFRKALDACSERNYGEMRGEIARDAFAIEVADKQVIPNNHEKYFRNMLAYNMFEGSFDERNMPTLEDTAVWLSEYFWTDLYKPYPKYENKKPDLLKHSEAIIKETLRIFSEANWSEFDNWLKRNAKSFKAKKLPDVRGNSVLMLWIKMLVDFDQKAKVMSQYSQTIEYQKEQKKFESLLNNIQQGIIYLIKSWSAQINIPDFKAQTPLMLATSNNKELIFEALLNAGAEVDAQDYHGRTALHSAIACNLVDFVKSLLAKKPDINKTTIDGLNVMHTAVRIGNPEIVRLLLDYAPELLSAKNDNGLTPVELVAFNLKNWTLLRDEMRRHNRNIGSKKDFESIISLIADQKA